MNFFQKLKCMQLPYGFRMTELINTSLTGPPKVSTLKIVDILPCSCLAARKTVRISQQKWTCATMRLPCDFTISHGGLAAVL